MTHQKKVGVIGSGQVAKVLGNGLLALGHRVMLSSRDITKLSEWKEKSKENALVGSFKEAAEFGDIIILAVSGRAATEAIESAGPQYFNGKTVIDPTNPISENPPVHGVLSYFTGPDESLMEILQARYPEANFVKAFNSVGNAYMVNPSFKEGKPSMFICGNNDDAKAEVTEILDAFGWETLDMGKVIAARAIEPLCILWCIPGFLRSEWNHAFKLMKA
ncbi:MAG: NAD(P)-binding domain-containing protein [Taibaiella sp.]|nr:NAD(P)-binding domain-containing protein [Taibaiella sp.]